MSYIGNSPVYQAFVTDSFSGNGSTVAFTLSYAPANTASIIVQIDAGLQLPSAYSVVGTVLTMSEAPPAGTTLFIRYLGVPASNIVTTAYRSVAEVTAIAGQTTFSVSSYVPGFINAYLNGVLLGSADYTATSGVSVVLAVGANAGDLFTVESFYVSSVLNAIPAVAGSVSSTYLAAGAAYQAFLDSASGTGTGALRLPAGTTAQRPTGAQGLVRLNITTGNPEWWDSTTGTWLQFSQPAGYLVNYLVVAGGGGGGYDVGGGGGAGGLLASSATVSSGTAYTITIGAAGAGSTSTSTTGSPGGNSAINSVVTALGGGGGGSWSASLNGVSGGSGGGSAGYSSTSIGGAGTSGQGYAGGSNTIGSTSGTGGGGGGAGSIGANSTTATAYSAGGIGLANAISGTSYAAGGAGSSDNATGAVNAPANTGNGGTGGGIGGGGPSGNNGYNGGSGIVIISYLGSQRGTGGTVTSSGGYTIHTFTSSGTYNA
jgi:hypothetical protein